MTTDPTHNGDFVAVPQALLHHIDGLLGLGIHRSIDHDEDWKDQADSVVGIVRRLLISHGLEQVGWRSPSGTFRPTAALTAREVDRWGYYAVYRLPTDDRTVRGSE